MLVETTSHLETSIFLYLSKIRKTWNIWDLPFMTGWPTSWFVYRWQGYYSTNSIEVPTKTEIPQKWTLINLRTTSFIVWSKEIVCPPLRRASQDITPEATSVPFKRSSPQTVSTENFLLTCKRFPSTRTHPDLHSRSPSSRLSWNVRHSLLSSRDTFMSDLAVHPSLGGSVPRSPSVWCYTRHTVYTSTHTGPGDSITG